MSKKIILISSSQSGVPVILELMENLQKYKIETYNIDILSGKQRFSDGKVENIYSNFFLKFLYRIPKIRGVIRLLSSRIYINQNIKKNDIVVLHFFDPGYLRYIKQLNKKTDNIIVHWWGSDLYRSDEKTKDKLKRINEKAQKHILVNGMTDYFLKHFPSEANKISYAKFGIKLLDIIKNLQENNLDIDQQKGKFSIPKNKIIVTCAYNGSPGQQHLKIIESLTRLPEYLKSNIFLIFPMTYGGDKKYISEINENLNSTAIKYQIITDYLTSENLASLRLITDITINIQISDGFSASIRESLYSENILIVGDWLPYEEIKKWGAFFIEVSLDELTSAIENTLINFEVLKRKTLNNQEIIYQNSAWSSCIKGIIEAYNCN